MSTDRLFEDAEDDPRWQWAELTAGAPPLLTKNYIAVPVAWLRRVLPVVRSHNQLAVAMLLYRRCLAARSLTVSLPNGALHELGISRQAKYRTLAELEEVGAITVVETSHGRAGQVTLHWFP
jgi:hypothetical protein